MDNLLKIAGKIDEASASWGRMGTVSLTGGEPYLRRTELYELADCLDRLDHIGYFDILTNGSLLDKRDATNLARLKKLRRVQMSLEGATRETNDYIRRLGSFESTLAAIRNLRSLGIEVSVMMTLTRKNVGEVPGFMELLGRENVSGTSTWISMRSRRGPEIFE